MSAPGQLTGSDLALDPKRREAGPREHLEGREEERTWLRRWCHPLKSSQTLSSVPLPSSTLALAPWPSLLFIKVKARPPLHLHSVDPCLPSLPLLPATSTTFQVLNSFVFPSTPGTLHMPVYSCAISPFHSANVAVRDFLHTASREPGTSQD